ncbi:dimethylmenaquinone methyltransferase [Mycolicibacterium agri]|uniref:Putative 4-hydroxy-4-methyl-2-oxoglutarate aldolase n=1 Tax=Mycolicibacterium agri TaxID=36811 RepID=A0A2A7MZ65_MYCAG|nr:dimethylmenaquinone methyltransferase [Mycolicibacterium agri]
MTISTDAVAELRKAGTATVYEARGRRGLIDVDLIQLIPGSCAAGPARTVLCAQDDNRGVHELVARIQPGEIAVMTMPVATPVALIGELLVTQLKERGAAAILVDAAVRDVDALRDLGVPVWTRWIRIRGATKNTRGEVDAGVQIGGAEIRSGDIVILDSDGAAVVPADEAERAVELAHARQAKEAASLAKYRNGEISYDLYGFRTEDEGNT